MNLPRRLKQKMEKKGNKYEEKSNKRTYDEGRLVKLAGEQKITHNLEG